jgi:hypothetical protein
VLHGLVLAVALLASATPTPTPSAQPLDLSSLTPAQQAAVQAAIVKLSQNPVGNIAAIPFQNNFNYNVGPYSRFQYNLNVQPVIPAVLGTSANLIFRTIIPILVQPSFAPPSACGPTAVCASTSGIGDITEQVFYAPKTSGDQLIWGIGPQFLFPTATPGTLGAGKWAAGPAAVALMMPGHMVFGILTTQLWSYAGQANTPNVSSALFQPFFNYNLKNGWTLTTGPNITANWVATQNKWAVPLGGGVSKTFKAGEQVMQISAQYYTYVARPITAPQTNFKVTWSLLYPIKRGIDIAELIKENM